MLTKVSNSPILLQAVADKHRGDDGPKKAKTRAVEEAVKLLPDRAQVDDVSLSGTQPQISDRERSLTVILARQARGYIQSITRYQEGKPSSLPSCGILDSPLQDTDEKCVLVSHYTSALNILEAFCKKKSYSYLRLDGYELRLSSVLHLLIACSRSTPTAKRQEHVNEFNRSSQNRCCTRTDALR